ncbi:MAG: Crp/Fnr family transcriptional regulator [Ruminococcus sp.]
MKFNPNCKNPGTCEDCRDRCIQDIAFLYGMPEEKQLDILRRSAHKIFNRGDFLFHEGDKVSSIVIIKQGQVKLSTYEADGRENIIGIFSDNDTIWEGVFSGDRVYPYSAVCLTKTYCCFVRRGDVETAISNPTVALRVINMLSNKLHDANERSRILSISEPVRRIAAFLIYREKRSNEPFVTLRLDDIAGSVGLRPETVSRNIRRLMNEGLIEKVGRSGFRIPDFEKLNSFVED